MELDGVGLFAQSETDTQAYPKDDVRDIRGTTCNGKSKSYESQVTPTRKTRLAHARLGVDTRKTRLGVVTPTRKTRLGVVTPNRIGGRPTNTGKGTKNSNTN